MRLSIVLQSVIAVAAVLSPLVALRVARTQAAHQSLVEAITRFDQAVNLWLKVAGTFVRAAEEASAHEAYGQTANTHGDVLRAYNAMTLLTSRRTRAWLERHWLKRQLRTHQAITTAATGTPDPEAARGHIEDYELGWPTVRDVLRRSAGVRVR